MPTALPSQRVTNENDFRPVLNSARLRKAVRAALFGTALGMSAIAPLALAAQANTATQQFTIPAG